MNKKERKKKQFCNLSGKIVELFTGEVVMLPSIKVGLFENKINPIYEVL